MPPRKAQRRAQRVSSAGGGGFLRDGTDTDLPSRQRQ